MSSDNRLYVLDGDVDTAVVAEWEASRRETIRRGLVVGGISVISATAIPLLLRVRNAFAQSEGDAAILESATGLEQIAVFSYQAAIDSGALDKDVTKVAELFRDQEQEHADGLGTALEALGGTRPAKPMDVKAVDEVLAGLGISNGLQTLKDQAGIAMFAIELETAAVAAYYDAHQKLQDAKLLQTGASIMANEGQHLVVLRQALGKPAVPNAFETGKA